MIAFLTLSLCFDRTLQVVELFMPLVGQLLLSAHTLLAQDWENSVMMANHGCYKVTQYQ